MLLPRQAGPLHPDLDLRLQARALVLALDPDLPAGKAADSLVTMAGATPAAPIAARRALARLQAANSHRPSVRTRRAIEALGLALSRVQERRSAPRSGARNQQLNIRTTRGDTKR